METKRVEDITEVHSGITFRKDKKDEAGPPVNTVQVSDLDDFHRLTSNNLNQRRDITPQNRHLLRAGDVIFSSKGEYNYATVIPEGLGTTVAVSSFLVLKNIRDDILPGYLAWYINSKEGQDYLSGVRSRTSIPYVSKTKFIEMPVKIPPVHTQKLIVKVDELKIREYELISELQDKRKKLIDATLLDHLNKKSTRRPRNHPSAF